MNKRWSIVFCFSLCLIFTTSKIFLVADKVRSNLTNPTLVIKKGQKIVFFGDSTNAGGVNYDGYCRLVVQTLKKKGVGVKAFYAGVPSYKSSEILFRLDDVLKQNPDHIFLSIGYNTHWYIDPESKSSVFKSKPAMGEEIEYFRIYISKILDRCEAVGTEAIMSTISHIRDVNRTGVNEKIDRYNHLLESLAKERKRPIVFLNERNTTKISMLKKDSAEVKTMSNKNLISAENSMQNMALGILKTMGFTDSECAAEHKEWNTTPKLLIAGGRQVTSGARPGGWISMLLDGVNCYWGKTNDQLIRSSQDTMATLVSKIEQSVCERSKYLLVIPPMEDLKLNTPIKEYEASILSLVEYVKNEKVMLALCTFPMVGSGIENTINSNAQPFNAVIKRICKNHGVQLVDIAKKMKHFFSKNLKTLNIGDERFNHTGGKLMAKTIFLAFGGERKRLSTLRKGWNWRTSYTYKYTHRTDFHVPLSVRGEEALQKMKDRFHKLDTDSILELGVYMLLNNKASTNQKRYRDAKNLWLSTDKNAKHLPLIKYPRSENEKNKIMSYIRERWLLYDEIYEQAFLIAMHAIQNDDLIE